MTMERSGIGSTSQPSCSLSRSDLEMIAETRPDMLLHMIRKDHIFDADKIETIFAYAKACALAELTENAESEVSE